MLTELVSSTLAKYSPGLKCLKLPETKQKQALSINSGEVEADSRESEPTQLEMFLAMFPFFPRRAITSSRSTHLNP